MSVRPIRLMKRPLLFKTCASMFACGVLLGIGSEVFAGVANGTMGYYGPIDGYSYENQATIYTFASGLGQGASAQVYAQNQAQANVPSGYMGAYAQLWNSSGALIESSGWIYNNGPAYQQDASTGTYTTHGTYYSTGFTAAYNGNGYTTYSTFRSPNQTY